LRILHHGARVAGGDAAAITGVKRQRTGAVLAAHIAGGTQVSIEHWKKAVEAQDALSYDEPPDWYYPVRESLGAALLKSGQAAEAEAVFRADLKRNPRSGRSLFGLLESLKAQKRTSDTQWVQSEFESAWKDSPLRLRGAGANFGVATSFEFRLHPLEGTIFQGMVGFPVDRSLEVVEHVREFVAIHDDVHVALAFTKAAELNDQPVFLVGSTHAGSVEEAESDLRVFRRLNPLMDTFQPRSYLVVQAMADEAQGWGQRFYTKAGFLAELSDEVVALCAAEVETIPPGAEISLWTFGGAVGRVPDDAMAYTGRNAPFNISAELSWTDPADDEGRIAWGRAAFAKIKPFMTTGRYVNDVVEAETDGAQIYGKAKYERLVGLKRKFDPDNFFRLNQNIKP